MIAWQNRSANSVKGWLASSDLRGKCFVAKRFPVPQKDKVKMVDDFSICGANGAYGLREKLRVQAVDELCSYLAYMLDVAKGRDIPKLTGRTSDSHTNNSEYIPGMQNV